MSKEYGSDFAGRIYEGAGVVDQAVTNLALRINEAQNYIYRLKREHPGQYLIWKMGIASAVTLTINYFYGHDATGTQIAHAQVDCGSYDSNSLIDAATGSQPAGTTLCVTGATDGIPGNEHYYFAQVSPEALYPTVTVPPQVSTPTPTAEPASIQLPTEVVPTMTAIAPDFVEVVGDPSEQKSELLFVTAGAAGVFVVLSGIVFAVRKRFSSGNSDLLFEVTNDPEERKTTKNLPPEALDEIRRRSRKHFDNKDAMSNVNKRAEKNRRERGRLHTLIDYIASGRYNPIKATYSINRGIQPDGKRVWMDRRTSPEPEALEATLDAVRRGDVEPTELTDDDMEFLKKHGIKIDDIPPDPDNNPNNLRPW